MLPHHRTLEETHPEAYVSVEELRDLPVCGFGDLADDIGQLACGAVSHAWLTSDHPDPRGSQLVALVQLLRRAQRGELPCQRPGWHPHLPLPPYPKLPPRFGLFYDWSSLYQSKAGGRTPAEQRAFDAALSSMQIWYVHRLVFTVLLSEWVDSDTSPPSDWVPGSAPAPCSLCVPYSDRGWPTVERCWAMLGKTNSYHVWPMLYDVASVRGEARRTPPMHPDRLEAELARKTFTSRKTDLPLVLELYRQTATSMLSGMREVVFVDVEWADAEFVRMAEALPLFTSCHTLRLYGNACGDEGAAALAGAVALGACPSLRRLDLRYNRIGSRGALALARAIDAGALPRLVCLVLSNNRIGRPALAAAGLMCSRRNVDLVHRDWLAGGEQDVTDVIARRMDGVSSGA